MFRKITDLKNILIIISFIVFAVLVLGEIRSEGRRCMGVPFITEEELQERAQNLVGAENTIYLEDYLTPYDREGQKIYISCNVEEDTKFYDVQGNLDTTMLGYDLYFLWEDEFDHMAEAVRNGHKFLLYVVAPDGNYTFYFVVFTTLPIVEMHGEVIGMDEQEREIYSGEITVWEPSYQDTGRLVVQNSKLEWHVRGFSSMSAIKKSLKLNLKEKNGENNNLSLLGFESDDDYILNPMWFDDVKVREKLAMDLWNQMAEEKGSSLKMSGGEYCELIIDNSYQGLRVMQNKIERSYLKLDAEDTLLKGKNVNLGTVKPPEEVYEIVYSNQTEEVTFRTISDFFYMNDFSNVNLESWVDLQLMMHLGNMVDNQTYKNIYYVIERDGDKESLSFIPWDTDMSFGVYWTDEGFRLLPETVESITYRMEYEELSAQYPQLDEMMAERWKELRENIFTEENIFSKVNAYTTAISDSGALKRDYDYLGWNSWSGEDTLENFKSYITRRLEVLDNYYGAK